MCFAFVVMVLAMDGERRLATLARSIIFAQSGRMPAHILERVCFLLVKPVAHFVINGLGEELAERIVGTLSPARRTIWQAKGPYGANQPWGEGVVHFCLRLLALRGVVCIAPRSGNKAPFVLLQDWLGPRAAGRP